jgi:hypothetical protein
MIKEDEFNSTNSDSDSDSGTGYNSKLKQPIYTAVKTEAVTLLRAKDQPITGCRFKQYTPNDEILKQLFSASTGSTWRTNNPEHTSKKETADVFYGAVNIHGLPMAVILDGCSRFAENKAVQFLAIQLISMLEKLTMLLQGSNFTDKQIKSHIKKQYETLDSYLYTKAECDAAFSAVALYEDSSGQLKSISFGIGDTMVALIEPNQKNISTVVAARNVNEEGLPPLSLPCQRMGKSSPARIMANLEQIIKIKNVKRNSKFVFLTDGSYGHLFSIQKVLDPDTEGVTMLETSLRGKAIQPATTAQQIIEAADQSVSLKFENDTRYQILTTVGDDTTAASMIVPTPEQQKELQAFLYNQAINFYPNVDAFKQRIVQMHDNNTKEIASLIKALIKTNYIITSCLNNEKSLLHDISDYVSYIQEEFSSERLFLGGMSHDLYDKAIDFFNTTLKKIEDHTIHQKANAMASQINGMYNHTRDNASLINALINANYLLTSFTANNNTLSPEVISKYRSYIREHVSNKSDLEWKKLGNDLIDLGIFLAHSCAQEKEKLAFSYDQAINSFDITLEGLKAKPELYNKALAVRNQIEQMRNDPSNDIVSLTKTLTETKVLITSYQNRQGLPQALSHYHTHIHTEVLSGKPSLELKMLGTVMIALGIGLAIAGGLNFAVGNVLGGVVCGGGGVALILAGCGIFSKGRGKGLYKLTSSLADGLEENRIILEN